MKHIRCFFECLTFEKINTFWHCCTVYVHASAPVGVSVGVGVYAWVSEAVLLCWSGPPGVLVFMALEYKSAQI